MSGEENLDTLQIEITSSSADASKSINSLVSSLKKLDKIGKSANLTNVKKQLQGIAKIQFDNLSTQLAAVTAYIRELQRSGKKISEIVVPAPTIEPTDVTTPLGEMVDEVNRGSEQMRDAVENFGQSAETDRPDWLDDLQSECQSISDSFETSVTSLNAARDKLTAALNEKSADFADNKTFITGNNLADSLDDKFERLRLQAEILQEKLNGMVENNNVDLTAWDNLEKQLLSVRLQYQALEQQINKNSKAVSELSTQSTKSTSKLGKLLSQIKRVALYRAIRFLLKEISQAASEGLQNIAQFSEEANSVMSEYKTEFLYMKNSVGSVLLPVLQSLLPTIIRIGDALVDIINSVGYLAAALNGQDTFIKAKKYAQDYADTLNEVKKSTTGFDELNILGQQDSSSTDYSEMFEEVDISGWDIAGSVLKITALVAGITTLVSLLKGVGLGTMFKNMGTGLTKAYNAIKNTSKWKKVGISIAAMAAEAYVCYDAIYGMASGTKSVQEGLLELIPVLAIAGTAMYAMWGPTGVIIAAVVAVISGVVAGIKAVNDAAKDRAMEKFWQTTGVAIDDVTDALYAYFDALGIDKQAEWNDTLADTISELNTAAINYNTLWAAVQNGAMSTTLIENLSNAFNDLADAANAVNDAAIGTLMASIATGIQMNITPELTAQLGDLVNKLEVANDLLNASITGISAEYQSILNEIAANGGKYTEEQFERLKELRAELEENTLRDYTTEASWQASLNRIKSEGIDIGLDDKDSLESVLQDLITTRNDYIQTLDTAYYNNQYTLEELIEKFPDLFSEADLEALDESYKAAVTEVNNQVNEVIKAIYKSLSENAINLEDIAGYKPESGENGFANFWSNFGYGFLKGITLGIYESGEKEAYDEQQEILAEILEYLSGDSDIEVPAHVNGGTVEDGLFMANSSEIIGKFTNGKNVAANNETIVAGIKQGVKEAIQESDGQGGDWTIQIINDGKIKATQVITAAQRRNQRDGKTVIQLG